MSPPTPHPRLPWQSDLHTVANRHHLDPLLLEAICWVESSYRFWAYRFEPGFWRRYLQTHPKWRLRRPEEVSASYGLMQTLLTTAAEEGFEGQPWDLFNPLTSLEFGARHLIRHLSWVEGFGRSPGEIEEVELRSALAAYNGGRRGNEPDDLPDRNAGYAEKVLRSYRQLQKEHPHDQRTPWDPPSEPGVRVAEAQRVPDREPAHPLVPVVPTTLGPDDLDAADAGDAGA